MSNDQDDPQDRQKNPFPELAKQAGKFLLEMLSVRRPHTGAEESLAYPDAPTLIQISTQLDNRWTRSNTRQPTMQPPERFHSQNPDIGRRAVAAASRNQQTQQQDRWAELRQSNDRLLNAIAQAKGLPPVTDFTRLSPLPPQPLLDDAGQVQAAHQSAAYPAFIAEDPHLIAAHLAHAQHPPSVEHDARLPVSRAQTGQVLRLQGKISIERVLPKAEINHRTDGKIDLWKKVHEGHVLSDVELKQLFHAIDLMKHTAASQGEFMLAEALRLQTEQRLAENIIAQAQQDEAGNLLLGGVPVRPEDAGYFARLDLQHFQATDQHLSPAQVMTASQARSSASQPRVRLLYVDASGISANPAQYYGRSFGHVALEVDGTLYNFTPAGYNKIPSHKYIEQVTNRSLRRDPAQNIYAYPIQLSPEEIARLKTILAKDPGKYQLPDNTCATHSINSLQAATAKSKHPIKIDSEAAKGPTWKSISPSDVIDSIKPSGRLSVKPHLYPIHDSNRKIKYPAYPWNWGIK